jgi:proteasome lid subunit RPN8/RPN11
MSEQNEPPRTPQQLEELRKRIKSELKKEILEEILRELKYEEKTGDEVVSTSTEEPVIETPSPSEPTKGKEETIVSITSILKIASHAFKYANSSIPQDRWVEVIGLLGGKLNADGHILYIEDAYPMGHGSAIYAEIKDYKNYARAFNDIKKRKYFICGWYHSHPTYGLFLSNEDFGTQMRYQRLWNKSVALVVDPYLIDGTSYGFKIFRADSKTQKWYALPFSVKGSFDARLLPELLEFILPIVSGKTLYIEYDEE